MILSYSTHCIQLICILSLGQVISSARWNHVAVHYVQTSRLSKKKKKTRPVLGLLARGPHRQSAGVITESSQKSKISEARGGGFWGQLRSLTPVWAFVSLALDIFSGPPQSAFLIKQGTCTAAARLPGVIRQHTNMVALPARRKAFRS